MKEEINKHIIYVENIKNSIPEHTINLFRNITKRVAPPPKLTISEWADNYRKLSSEASAEPGQWRTDRAPFQKGIMDAISDTIVESVVIMSSAQVGKTEMLLNVLGYYIDYSPAPILLVMPTLEMAEGFSKDRVTPMVRDTPNLRGKIKDSKAKNSGNTILHKSFPGGHITMAGANSPASLSSRPIQVLLCDEVDRFPVSAGTEGDPVLLAEKRTTTFWNRKKVKVSTPTIKGASRIELEYENSSMEEWFLPCPLCGEYQALSWQQIKFKDDKYDKITHECKYCKGRSSEVDWKNSKGKWFAKKENFKRKGFHLNELISPWKTWEEIAEDFLEAKRGGNDKLRVWVNTSLGESWEVKGESVEHDALLARRETYNAEIPDGVLRLTAAVDVQDNRLEVEVVGWGLEKESWGIEYRVFVGNIGLKDVWNRLDEYLKRTWSFEDGYKLGLSCVCIDSGGHFTTEVYTYTMDKLKRRIFSIKGVGGTGRPIVGRPSRNNKQKAILFPLGVDTGKELLMSNLKIDKPGPGYCHFPLNVDRNYDETYFKGLTSEKRVLNYEKSRPVFKWVKKPGYTRNEPLDLRNYNLAAIEILNPNFNLIAKKPRVINVNNTINNDKKAVVKRRRVISKGVT